MGLMRSGSIILIGKLQGRPKRRWEDNIKIDLRERGYEVVD
jgi:hypothetical protein